ncbi:hypothetical protein GCM10008018_61490 [Paenibacillus marchantiophytorum]|uniref:Uncharacterized protein n=1 Tax=Paenibacillus marchantiophytorum TaxID=1619310 RepID=A0ABQ1FDW2_9BACL|nr:hypothetical protein GCM10008018_61490 [Paenibacillus marchantiophytorum]
MLTPKIVRALDAYKPIREDILCRRKRLNQPASSFLRNVAIGYTGGELNLSLKKSHQYPGQKQELALKYLLIN